MQTLSTRVRHARITTREVLVHLRKTGGLKRKQYLHFLKSQYLIASRAYISLCQDGQASVQYVETNDSTAGNHSMPVQLTTSELSSMSKYFGELTFLNEALHLYQTELLKTNHVYKQKSQAAYSTVEKLYSKETYSGNQLRIATIDVGDQNSQPANQDALHSVPQKSNTRTLASGFGNLLQSNCNFTETTPFCIQILKWAQEGKLCLN